MVTSNANVPGEVRPYSKNLISSNDLQDRIYLKLEQGTGGSFNDCTGFTATGTAIADQTLSALSTTNHDYATGGHHGRQQERPGRPIATGQPGVSTPQA